MHDPDVVAFEIRRPWPRRDRSAMARGPFWTFRGPFWTLGGIGFYWPCMITIWHREPGGADSGEVCKHYLRWQNPDGKWQSRMLGGWRWHIHHWRIQVGPLQALRRWALTRCSWCGGRSRKGDRIDVSHQWDAPRGRWWRGEPGLFHRDCSAIATAHRTCVCDDPLLQHRTYGPCLVCGKSVSFGRTELRAAQARILAAVPTGQRDPAAYQQICDMYAASKAAEQPEGSDRGTP
jgi:hypothetical protein